MSRLFRTLAALGCAALLARAGDPSPYRLGTSVALAAPIQIRTAHGTFSFKGVAAPVLKGQEPAGLFLKGEGDFEVRSEEPTEFPRLDYNLWENASLKAPGDARVRHVRDTFRTGLVIASGVALPELTGAPGPSLEPEFQAHLSEFKELDPYPLAQVTMQREANHPRLGFLWAELKGSSRIWNYRVDPVAERMETLSLYVHPDARYDAEFRSQLQQVPISRQPMGWTWKQPPPPPFQLTHVKLDVLASDDKDVRVVATETLVPLEENLRAFRFDLLDRRYVALGLTWDKRLWTVKAVTDAAGRALPFDHRLGELVVVLPEPVKARAPFVLRFELEGNILYRPAKLNAWQLGVMAWFPQPGLDGQFYTVEAKVSVPKPFVPVMPGTTVSRRTEGDREVLETRIEKPIQFFVVSAGKYRLQEETRNGITVRTWNYGQDSSQSKRVIGLAFDAIDFYQTFLGPFPFQEFNIVEEMSWGYGQAPPGFMYITQEAFNPTLTTAGQWFSKDVNARFAHEIAHQYWGHVVKMPSHEEQWLTESFAEICSALFVKYAYGKEGPGRYDRMAAEWKGLAEDVTKRAPIHLANEVATISAPAIAFRTRTGLIYHKGALLLDHVRKELGDEGFKKFLLAYQKSFQWKFGSTAHVAGLLKVLTKKDWMPFFEANYWGTGLP